MSQSRIFYQQQHRLFRKHKRRGVERPLNLLISPATKLIALKDSRTRKPVPQEWIDVTLHNLTFCYQHGQIDIIANAILRECKKSKSSMSKLFIKMLRNHEDPRERYALIGNYLDKNDGIGFNPSRINNGKATFISAMYYITKTAWELDHERTMRQQGQQVNNAQVPHQAPRPL